MTTQSETAYNAALATLLHDEGLNAKEGLTASAEVSLKGARPCRR